MKLKRRRGRKGRSSRPTTLGGSAAAVGMGTKRGARPSRTYDYWILPTAQLFPVDVTSRPARRDRGRRMKMYHEPDEGRAALSRCRAVLFFPRRAGGPQRAATADRHSDRRAQSCRARLPRTRARLIDARTRWVTSISPQICCACRGAFSCGSAGGESVAQRVEQRPRAREFAAMSRKRRSPGAATRCRAVRVEPARVGAVEVAQRAVRGDVRGDTAERREERALLGCERSRGVALRRDQRKAAAHDVVEAAAFADALDAALEEQLAAGSGRWRRSSPGRSSARRRRLQADRRAPRDHPRVALGRLARIGDQITRPSATEKSIVARACGARSLP